LVIFNEKDGQYDGKSICLKGQVIVSPFLCKTFSEKIRKNRPNPLIMKYLLLALFLISFEKIGHAQDFSQTLKAAQRLENEGKYGDAAEQYEAAWRQKTGRADLIYKAGECFYWSKDYHKAAECYRNVTGRDKEFELVTLKYARALKQDGRYEEAMKTFKFFEANYTEKDRPEVVAIIQNDLKGCQLGIDLTLARAPSELPVDVSHLPDHVNTPENEFAPVPFGDDILYFSSLVSGAAKIYRTQRVEGKWVQSANLKEFPAIEEAHFGNGVFAPDGKRFYFTECGNYGSGNGLRARCEIYMTKREPTGWSKPEKLRDYINALNFTTTQPFVVHDRGIEYLFFASDREGGEGGMDVWMCQRVMDGSEDIDFSYPSNLGNKINTPGDEITPFFDPSTQTLYFSSNGQISLGGFDIQKSVRTGGKWTKPENMGIPFNSNCDDFSFFLKKSGNGGFLVSNRLFGLEKTTTRDEDIFEFSPKESRLEITGRVLDVTTATPIGDCLVALYELIPGEESRLLQVRPTTDGAFKFPALVGKKYWLEASKDGFESANIKAGADEDGTTLGYQIDFRLAPQMVGQGAKQELPTASASTSYEEIKPKTKGQKTKKTVSETPVSTQNESQNPPSIFYKIQILSTDNPVEKEPILAEARPLGDITSEYLTSKKVYRHMLGDFPERTIALDILRKAKANGFPQAFLVKYVNGKRQ
jgi:WD40-like Beta Propeller Repeat